MTENLKPGELLPCPFCGNEYVDYELIEEFDIETVGLRKVHLINCCCCPCKMSVDGFYEFGNEKGNLFKDWNTRHNQSPKDGEE